MVTFAMIADSLKGWNVTAHGIPRFGKPLKGCRWLSHVDATHSTDYVYLTDDASLDAASPLLDHVRALVILSETDPLLPDHAYLHIPCGQLSPLEAYEQIQAIFERFETGFVQALALSALHDRSVEALLEIAYPFFGNPIYLCDSAFQLLAFSRTASVQSPTPQWVSVTERGQLDPDIIKMVKVSKIDELDSMKRATFVDSVDAEGVKDIVTHIEENGERIANLTIVGSESPLQPYHLALADFLTSCVKSALENTLDYSEASGALYDRWIADLLSGKEQATENALPHLERLRWKTDDAYRIAVIDFQDDRASGTNTLDYYWRLLHLAMPDHRCFIYEGAIVILMHGRSNAAASLELASAAEALVRNNGLRCALSFPFESIAPIAAHYDQARRIQTMATADAPIVRYADHQLDDILSAVSFAREWESNICPEVRTLHAYDEAHGTDLVHTLLTHLLCSCNYTESAQMLNVHRNTVIYRMKRMATEFGIDVEDHQKRLPYLISCSVCRTMAI